MSCRSRKSSPGTVLLTPQLRYAKWNQSLSRLIGPPIVGLKSQICWILPTLCEPAVDQIRRSRLLAVPLVVGEVAEERAAERVAAFLRESC